MRRETIYCVLAALLACQWANANHAGNSELIEEVVVYGRADEVIGTANQASAGTVAFDDIRLPPLLRVGELVEAVPGMVATQHSGTGKANQYFLRGFNLDHGTDFSAFVDGVPINLRTHGHGQGYLDLNFIIPELVERTSYRKGPYAVRAGDFSSAGSVSFDLADALDESFLSATVGEFDFYRGVAGASARLAGGSGTFVYDFTAYGGPWNLDEDLSQTRFYANYVGSLGTADAKVSLLGYLGEWNASDQIPLRAVEAGLIDERGNIDPLLGGQTDRFSLTSELETDAWKAMAYIVDYDFALFSNFTYLLEEPENGDQFEQVDKRRIYGARIDGTAALPITLNWGGDLRYDDISEVGLFRTFERQRTGTVRLDSVEQFSASAYAELELRPSERVRAALGVRADHFSWNVDALRPENSGSGRDTQLSPKLNLAYRLGQAAEFYANWGRGFHSNDVRGNTITVDPATGEAASPVDALVPSEGAELGLRFERGDRFNATLTGFWLDLDSELLFVGDAGGTEVNGASTRKGVELATFFQATEWLAVNFAYTHTSSKFEESQGGGQEIPGAIEAAASLGLNGVWDNGLFVSARARYLGEAPLIEDDSVRSPTSLLVNIGGGYRFGDFSARVDVFNLFESDDFDIAYFYASRLPGEGAGGVEDIHFRPLEPRSIRASLTLHW
ncbi:MAG: TonB-dependent receptor [Pseudomonadota bacterium]